MPDPRDVLDLSSDNRQGTPQPAVAPNHGLKGPSGRSYLRLWFRCSGQYTRAQRSPDGTTYVGRCPKCGRTARFPIGPGGTSRRSFEVSCQ